MIKTRMRLGHGERGATLLLVLILMSITSIILAAVLAQADTAERSTIQLRDQAANDYSADGAMQAVLNALKTSGINCGNPTAAAPATLGSTASPFYAPDSSNQGPINAYAECTPDAINGISTATSVATSTTMVTPPAVTSTAPYLGQGDPTLPSYAVLTTGSASSDFGLDVSSGSPNTPIYIENGSVGSKKDINATSDCLLVRIAGTGDFKSNCNQINNFGTGVDSASGTRLVVKAQGSCIGGASVFNPTSCQASATDVAAPPPPNLPGPIVANNPTPLCKTVGGGSGNQTTYAVFYPGLYDSAASVAQLSNHCSSSANTTYEWLSPGNYYFNFPTGSVWTWPTRLIAGTPTTSSGGTIANLDPTKASSLTNLANVGNSPGACMNPAPPATGVQGVAMMFAGTSTVAANTNSGSAAELCASSPDTQPAQNSAPPVAIYGLTQDSLVSRSSALGGNTTLPAQATGSNSLINTTYANNNGHASVYIRGYVYAPNAQFNLLLQNASGQVFNWGVIAKDLRLSLNGSSPLQPVFQLPKPNTGVGTVVTTSTPPATPSLSYSTSTTVQYSIRYINVWTCTTASQSTAATCPHTGPPNAQAKVLTDANGVPVKILSWTHVA